MSKPGESVLGGHRGWGKKGSGTFSLSFIQGKLNVCVCEREREKYPALTFSIQHPHLVNHVKKTKN